MRNYQIVITVFLPRLWKKEKNITKAIKGHVKGLGNFRFIKEFRIKDPTAYSNAYRKGLIEELFNKHENKGGQFGDFYWTKERLKEEVKKYQYRTEFYKKNSSAYKAAIDMKIMDELFDNHLNKGIKSKPA